MGAVNGDGGWVEPLGLPTTDVASHLTRALARTQAPAPFTFTRDLQFGDRGRDVRQLQTDVLHLSKANGCATLCTISAQPRPRPPSAAPKDVCLALLLPCAEVSRRCHQHPTV